MKKLFLILVAMLATFVASAATVTFDNSAKKWTTVNAYWWNGNAESVTWPGKAMTNKGNDKWEITISGTPEKIIFNNGSGEQTANLDFVDGATYNFDGVVSGSTTIYLRGAMNSWGTTDAWKFANEEGTDNYTLTDVTIRKGEEFKVADANWGSVDFGGVTDMVAGKTYTLSSGTANCTLAEDFNGDVLFKLDSKEITFTAKGTVPELTEYPIAIAGAFNSWSTTANVVTVPVANPVAKFTIEKYTNAVEGQAEGFKVVVNGNWKSNGEALVNGKVYAELGNDIANMTLPASAEGKDVTITFDGTDNSLKVEWEAEEEVTPDPNDNIYAVIGAYCGWEMEETTEEATSMGNAETNCAVMTVTNYTNGEGDGAGFQIICNDLSSDKFIWYGVAEGTTVVNGEWFSTVEGGQNIVLPASAEGKTVKFTFSTDKHTLCVEWEEGEVVEDDPMLQGGYIFAVVGAFCDWSTSDVTDFEGAVGVMDPDTNCVELSLEKYTNTAEGQDAGFKIVALNLEVQSDNEEDVVTWFGSNETAVNGEWIQLSTTGDNIVLPESAEGKTVKFTFAVDTKNLKVEWTEPVVGEEVSVSICNEANGWNLDINKTVINTADTKVAVVTVENWTNEPYGFNVVVNGKWLSNKKVEVLGKWMSLTDEAEDGRNNWLPAACEGKAVTFKYDVEKQALMVECDCDPVYNIALVGLNNEWNANNTVASVDGIVTWEVESYEAPYGFKIVNKDAWMGNGETLQLNTPYVVDAEIDNMSLLAGCNGKKVTFTYTMATETLVVSCPDFDTEAKEYVSLAGDFNGWSAEANVAEVINNVATFIVPNWVTDQENPASTGFKFVYNGTWYGKSAEMANDEWMYDLDKGGQGNNLYLPFTANGATITFCFAVDTLSAKATWETNGIENVSADIDADAIYYNLQGRRVLAPAAGQLYIVVRGNQSSKEIVK